MTTRSVSSQWHERDLQHWNYKNCHSSSGNSIDPHKMMLSFTYNVYLFPSLGCQTDAVPKCVCAADALAQTIWGDYTTDPKGQRQRTDIGHRHAQSVWTEVANAARRDNQIHHYFWEIAYNQRENAVARLTLLNDKSRFHSCLQFSKLSTKSKLFPLNISVFNRTHFSNFCIRSVNTYDAGLAMKRIQK